MNTFALMWIGPLLAAVASGPAALAQTIYKCGNNYSQSPCPGGSVVDADDPRTPAQKAQADRSAGKAAKAAERLERDRLAAQKAHAAPASTRPAVMAAPKEPASAPRTPTAKAQKPGPPYFTAAVPPDKIKHKADKKKESARANLLVEKPAPDSKP